MNLNIAESLNSMLRDKREYPVAIIFNSIAHRFGEIFRKRKYDLVKFPYALVMAALHLKHGDEYNTSIYNYSLNIYLKESYLLAYLEPIYAASLESEWSVAREYLEMQVLSPNFDFKLRRRNVKRVKGVLEPLRCNLRDHYLISIERGLFQSCYLKERFFNAAVIADNPRR
ncbi:hypothetical protein CQW23_03347 [Capsicum baccatum]|uniref:Uncharacterized protein n=1 Tax=Capsicum baccatum TaxID=33114 RepID=A0A2G2XBY3_CAPBA|nr:hypothetical protein CQW23_03347 [Capsicum baccatum]